MKWFTGCAPPFPMMTVLFLLVALAMTSGCAANMSTGYAGVSSYHIKPVLYADDTQAVCCEVDIVNGKETAAIAARIKKTADGGLVVDFTADDVKAFEGQQIAAQVASEVAKTVRAVLPEIAQATVQAMLGTSALQGIGAGALTPGPAP